MNFIFTLGKKKSAKIWNLDQHQTIWYIEQDICGIAPVFFYHDCRSASVGVFFDFSRLFCDVRQCYIFAISGVAFDDVTFAFTIILRTYCQIMFVRILNAYIYHYAVFYELYNATLAFQAMVYGVRQEGVYLLQLWNLICTTYGGSDLQ